MVSGKLSPTLNCTIKNTPAPSHETLVGWWVALLWVSRMPNKLGSIMVLILTNNQGILMYFVHGSAGNFFQLNPTLHGHQWTNSMAPSLDM